ncbi:hypothetical protein TIFTF001_013943 [Ficus carica]|uniref:Uncharacterized protein n=1 Tax=Ficus carica TaxID=3494 RepID=A0AA88AQL5_FICCA|nr:hypothetical protein TIFTF001_013943 [Ficus carica]
MTTWGHEIMRSHGGVKKWVQQWCREVGMATTARCRVGARKLGFSRVERVALLSYNNMNLEKYEVAFFIDIDEYICTLYGTKY